MRRPNVLSLGLVCLGFAACTAPPPFDVGESAAAISYPWTGSSPDYSGSPSTGIVDRGGPAISSTTTVQLIFYGNFTLGRRQLFHEFIQGLNQSPLANVLTTYTDAYGVRPNAQILLAQPDALITDTSRFGSSIDGDEFQDVITSALSGLGKSGPDANTIYAVLTDENIGASFNSSTYCQNLVCGWHGSFDDKPMFVFVGNPNHCPSACLKQSITPNGDAAADNMINFLWHEIAEAITDPQPIFHPGFYDPEAGDLCEGSPFLSGASWTSTGYAQIDASYFVSGAPANVHLGAPYPNGNDYLVQPLWQNLDGGGGCVRRLVANRPSVSIDPHHPVGDLDGDGLPDLLFHSIVSRNVARIHINGDATLAAEQVFGAASDAWQLYGVADFDTSQPGSEILWREHDTGALSIWVNGSPHHITESSLDDWVIRGVGNFDGMGGADILFQSMSTNQVRIYFNNGTLPPLGLIGDLPAVTGHQLGFNSNFDVVGVGDFDGDTKADVLWHQIGTTIPFQSESHNFIWWKMVGSNAVSAAHVDDSRFDSVLGLADVHGNGRAQIVGLKGQTVVWADVANSDTGNIGILPSKTLRYAGSSTVQTSAGGLEGSLLFQDRRTGEILRWVLDRTTGVGIEQALLSTHSLRDELIAY